jgi:adenylosuccinate lyase
MLRNLELTKGLIFSGQLLLDLAAAGMLREQAYKIVQGHAMHSWEEDSDFRTAIESDPEVRKYMNPEKISASFAVPRYLKNVDAIFQRVFESTYQTGQFST